MFGTAPGLGKAVGAAAGKAAGKIPGAPGPGAPATPIGPATPGGMSTVAAGQNLLGTGDLMKGGGGMQFPGMSAPIANQAGTSIGMQAPGSMSLGGERGPASPIQQAQGPQAPGGLQKPQTMNKTFGFRGPRGMTRR